MESETQAAPDNGTITANDGTPESAASPSAADELASVKALAEERLNELAYARAEIENVRKRAQRIADERLSHGRKQLLGKFLPVLDNLQRSLAFDDSEALRGGLQATLKGFEGLLASESIVAVETIGKPFDPHVAEAIGTRETPDHDDDVVVAEAQRGYRLGEELLRPALVFVAKRVPAAGA
jgi:molecular chaperone GrpE